MNRTRYAPVSATAIPYEPPTPQLPLGVDCEAGIFTPVPACPDRVTQHV